MEKIDIVIPYVNGIDPEWQKIHNIYRKNVDYTRFDGHDILKYVLRSIDKYLPWINKVHLLVMQESQIPEYVNRETVHIVYHKDFIPEEHLPTFNANTIEMYLWNIPDLSENFIYINDDILFNNPISQSFFFTNDMLPLITIKPTYYNSESRELVHFKFFCKSIKLAAIDVDIDIFQNDHLLKPGHGSSVFKLSNLRNIYELYKEEIEESITKFRDERNINQYFLSCYQFFHEMSLMKPNEHYYFKVDKNHLHSIEIALKTFVPELCLNDVDTTTLNDKIKLQELLSNKFKEVSKYEI